MERGERMKRGYPYPKLPGFLLNVPEQYRRELFWWGRERPVERMYRKWKKGRDKRWGKYD